jgi:5'-methylthioadenosine phosphorylase
MTTRDDSTATAAAAILGSAFPAGDPEGLELEPLEIATPYGPATIHRAAGLDRPAYVLFRHGVPHRFLPHQVPYRAHAWALHSVGCRTLLVTSSVGVLTRELPLHRMLLVADLLMPDNRLPDGSACTMFTEPSGTQGHLVLGEGLFSLALMSQVRRIGDQVGWPAAGEVVFAYVGGPRTKTPAENRMWAQLGAHVNSMSLGPEVVLANELEIPTAGLVVGHKYSVPGLAAPADEPAMAESLARSREALARLVRAFLERAIPVAYENRLHRFRQPGP